VFLHWSDLRKHPFAAVVKMIDLHFPTLSSMLFALGGAVIGGMTARRVTRGNWPCAFGFHDPMMHLLNKRRIGDLFGEDSPIFHSKSEIPVGLFCKRCHLPIKK